MKYLAFIACLLFSFQLAAQRYVLFNPSCTERLKYNNQFGEEQVAYTLQISATERIILEIGTEAKNYKNRISGALISCNNPNLNRGIADLINNNSGTTFYMVRREGKGKFLVSPILSAAYFRFDSGNIEYATKDYAFQYDMRKNQRNTNLNTISTATQVFFVGSTNYDCRKGYTFSISDRNGGLSDLTILPEVGIVDNVAFDSKRRLATINATNFQDFLSAVCNGNTIYNDPSLAGVNSGDIDFEDNFGNRSRNATSTAKPTTTTMPTTSTAVTTTSTAGTYRPEPVRTPSPRSTTTTTSTTPIYRPASSSNTTTRTYSPSIGHRDVIIRDGDYSNTEKRLATDIARGNFRTASTSKTSYTAPQTDVYTPRGVTTKTTVAAYNNSNYRLPPVGASNSNYGTVRVNTTSGNMHVVQKRETAYSIAKAYGISLEQLGRWNNLQDFILYPGEKLVVRGGDTFTSRGAYTTTNRTTTTTTYPVSSPVTTVTRTVTPSNRYGTPAWQTTNGEHVVKNGETATSIAAIYGYTLDRFLDLNGLSKNTVLYPGQRLKTSDCSARPDEGTGQQTKNNAVRTNYFDDEFSKKGGNNTGISPISPAPYYTSQQRLNGSSNSYQSIRKGGKTHRVRQYETLFSIAKSYNTSVGELMQLNRMEVACLLYTSPSPRDISGSRMPSSA